VDLVSSPVKRSQFEVAARLFILWTTSWPCFSNVDDNIPSGYKNRAEARTPERFDSAHNSWEPENELKLTDFYVDYWRQRGPAPSLAQELKNKKLAKRNVRSRRD
jgi:hypothetical protein